MSVLWADEIVLFDLGSTDNTLTIAEEFRCRIETRDWVPVVEMVRQEAINACTGEWILVLDPDEVVPHTLAAKLGQVARESDADAVSIPWQNMIFGHWMRYSGWSNDRHIRFFRKGTVNYPNQVHAGEVIAGKVLKLPEDSANYMLHYNYDSVHQFLEKLNRYTALEAKQLSELPTLELIAKGARAPLFNYRSRFFDEEGYKDGLHGFAVSGLMASYWSTAHAKAFELQEWPKVEESVLLSHTRKGLLNGLWDITLGMERTSESQALRMFYRMLRAFISIGLRLRLY